MPVVILVHRLPRLAVIEERRGEKSSSSSSLGSGVQMLFVTLGTSQSVSARSRLGVVELAGILGRGRNQAGLVVVGRHVCVCRFNLT